MNEAYDTVVIGGGQAGLSVGYFLAQQQRTFVILDANERVGDAWRKRWDSLLLFTPARIDGLPGLRFPARGDSFINKDQMADFLETYARHFNLPVLSSMKVTKLSRENGRFVVQSSNRSFEADNVVVAMSNFQVPRVPPFAKDLDPSIVQIHSFDYRNPSQLRDGGVLVVGVGNSGADISLETAKTHRTWLAGKEAGAIPFRIETFFGRHILARIVRFVGHNVMTVKTPMGRKMRSRALFRAAPLIRVKLKDLTDAGIERVPRVTGVKDGQPLLADGRTLDVKNVIWCTGFEPGFSWIDLPVLGERQEPLHESGIVSSQPGLYFVGLHFLHSLTSATISGVPRDARRVVHHIATRTSS